MKLFFSTLFFFLWTQTLYSNDFDAKYAIKAKGITIGSLKWELSINNNNYKTSLYLKNTGILSSLFAFEGKYGATGGVKSGFFLSREYDQFWKTKNKERFVKIIFENTTISNLTLQPKEKEKARIDFKKLKEINDPITSFLNVILNKKPSYTVDGRRVYFLSPIFLETSIKISIEKYKNIWADHKRNDLEYIEVFLEKNHRLPKKINIMFKGSVFSLNKI